MFSILISRIIQLNIFFPEFTIKNQYIPICVDNHIVFDKLIYINKLELRYDSRGKGFKNDPR
jgi:hypothetical protein